jgi:O-antigen/teichoic acid export membrane protein
MTESRGKTTGAAVLRGGSWNVLGTFVPQLSLLAISIAAARFLGPDRFGRQSFIAFVEISVLTLFTAGLPLALARFVGTMTGEGRPGVAVGLVRWIWRLEAVGAVAGGALLAAIGLLGAEPRAAWLLASVVVFASVLQRVPSALLTGLQRWRTPSLISIVVACGAAVATIVVLASGGGITGMFAVEAAAGAATLAWLGVIARKARASLGAAQTPDAALRRAVLGYAAFTGAGVVLTLIVWRRSEFLFLDRFSTEKQIALYSVAFSSVSALLLVPQAVIAAVLPAVATLLGAREEGRVRRGFARALRLLLIVTVPVTAFALALGPLALRLVYGRAFDTAGSVLIVLLAPFPALALVNLANVLLAGMNRLRLPLVWGLVGAVVNIALDFALIPPFDAVGAAFANIGGQLTAGLPVLVYAIRLLQPVAWSPGALSRTIVASVGGGLAAWAPAAALGGVGGLALGLAAGACAFAGLAAALRILPADDARWLDEAAGGRLGLLTRAWAAP